MNRAFIFPGQGSQYIGMGKDLAAEEVVAKNVYNELDQVLGRPLSEIIFNGIDEQLADTVNTQNAIMATSIALLQVIMQYTGKNIEDLCTIVAGHSLGEYSALCASNALTFEQTTELLNIRSKAMQEACIGARGGMAACIGIGADALQEMLDQVCHVGGICQIANDNILGQIVISGQMEVIDLMVTKLKEKNFRCIKLNVSGAFHSQLMKPAENAMKLALSAENFNTPIVPIISNIDAQETLDPNKIKDNLIKQICGSVQWRSTLDKLIALGITEIVEIGPGRILSNLAKKSGHNFEIYSISNLEEVKEFAARIRG